MKFERLTELLNELAPHCWELIALQHVISDMYDAGDSNISFSVDNLGINITKDAIDFVDLISDKSIAMLKLELKED